MANKATVNLGTVEAVNVSDAVARGRAVIEALSEADAVMLDTDDTDGSEVVWDEMVAYLDRRGVSVAYDHDDGNAYARHTA